MKETHFKFYAWCIVGLLLSTYATHVELRAEQDSDYVALCDIGPKVSCTAVFTSIYGRGFGLLRYVFGADAKWIPPNGVLGIFFYVFLSLSIFFRQHYLVSLVQLLSCLVSNMMSAYLAYLLYFVLDDLCVVCAAIYVVNCFCLLESWSIYSNSWRAVVSENKSKAIVSKLD